MKPVRRLVLIANPAASQFTGGSHRDVLIRLKRDFEVTAEWPEDAASVTEVARQSALAGVDLVIAMGGDGVVNRVVNGIALTETALGIIPVGTTNVLAEIVGVDSNAMKAADQICAIAEPRPMSLVRVSLDDKPPTYATFAVGAGFDAEVVQEAERAPHKKLFMGGLHYARTSARVLWNQFRHRLPTLRVETDGSDFDAVVAMVQIHWPYTYFGRIPLSIADAPPTAGFHIAGFDRLPPYRIPAIALASLRGTPWDHIRGGYQVTDQKRAVIHADPATVVQADGDVIGKASLIQLESLEGGVLVFAQGSSDAT